MSKQIIAIISAFIRSVSDFKSGAFKYLFYSGMIALSLFIVLFYSIYQFSGAAGEWLASKIPWSWAQESLIFSFLVGLAVLYLFWILMKYIMLMLLSPLLTIVSEKAEEQLTGKIGGAGFSFGNSAVRSVRINMRNMLKEIVFTILLLIAGLIPGLNVFALIAMFLVQAYFAGFGIMDFYLERHLTLSQAVRQVYAHKWAAITLGGIFTILLLIPVFGVIVAPYFTTITATRYFGLMNKSEAAVI